MSQNPYAAYGNPNEPLPEARTSVLAILSLVTALSCCLSFLAPFLGGAAILRIGGSGGRRKGSGLAISGIIIGLVITALEVFFIVGAWSLANQATAVFTPISQKIIADDPSSLRNAVSPTLKTDITDAEWTRFKSEISAELGTLQPPPTSLLELFKQYGEVGKLMQNQQAGANAFPIPLVGDKGKGILLIHLPRNTRVKTTSASGPGSPAAAILAEAENFSVILPSGAEVWLVPPPDGSSTPKVKPSKPDRSPLPTPVEPKNGGAKPNGV
jgi:hypothetical protein